MDNPKISFDAVLRREAVVSTIERLRSEPDNPAHRQALVAALADAGWSFLSAPARLKVDSEDRGLLGFLRGLLAFDVRGLQVGNNNTQRNEFVHMIIDSPTGANLLRGNRVLATALANYPCPRGDAERDVAELSERVRGVLAGLRVDWPTDRERGRQYRVALARAHYFAATCATALICRDA